MNAAQYADSLVLDQRGRRDWLDPEAYQGHAEWSYRRWAWHFLQRNPEYQKTSTRPPGPLSRTRANEFGRSNLKRFSEPYSHEDEHRKCWLAEVVAEVDSCAVGTGKEVNYRLEPGEVAFVIDLRRTLDAGRAAMTAMVIDVRKRLDEELVRFEKSLSRSGHKVSKICKPRRDKLLQRLRMCDAMWKRATDDELIRKFYPSSCKAGVPPTGDARAQVIRKVRRDQKAAIEMMMSGYLSLVPLDYIQDKSSKKTARLDKEFANAGWATADV